ncbi:MAG: PIN-like domain-containing protein [Desulfobacterales bacterium]|nr:DUF4935 domain-containing protein [Pseudomonadota bacterium]MBU4357222.1 DUF4935 domain-containing protein [Pseudomonadota bacterium]MCG2773958.1 PIN-like domain-containing protein [Desulfobacterales bacterium]
MDNPFNRRAIFPNPADTFGFRLEPINTIKDDCLFVLDANVLLLPFTTGVKSLNAIKKVYESLKQQKRVFVPAQSAREFLHNRSKKLSDIHEALYKKMTQSFQYIGSHPLLSEIEEYKALVEQEDVVREAIIKHQSEIKRTIAVVQSWGWDDPVSKMYHEVLGGCVLSDHDINLHGMLEDLERRNQLSIPPGYKDKTKDGNQAGDLLIWHEILKIGEEQKKHIIFVSGDEKADWWHRSGNQPLYPRFELVDEFRIKSGGKSFHIMSLSKLLQLFEVEPDVVEAVKSSEKRFAKATKQSLLSNEEIVERALHIVKELRVQLAEERRASESLSNQRMSAMRSATTQEEKNNIWETFNQIDREPTQRLMQLYKFNFKVDAILLRDEMLARLPEDILLSKRERSFPHMYEHPTNPLGLEAVIDDLEYLAKCMP